jgi:hypothetical protein
MNQSNLGAGGPSEAAEKLFRYDLRIARRNKAARADSDNSGLRNQRLRPPGDVSGIALSRKPSKMGVGTSSRGNIAGMDAGISAGFPNRSRDISRNCGSRCGLDFVGTLRASPRKRGVGAIEFEPMTSTVWRRNCFTLQQFTEARRGC